MDLFFITVSIVFIFFLIISYYLNIIKLSAPIILIYLVFCFSYVINNDIDKSNVPENLINKNMNSSNFKDDNFSMDKKNISDSPKVKEKNFKSEKIEEVSRPIVSYNPKPIIIDSNLIIQKNKEKTILADSISKPIKNDSKSDEQKNDEIINTLKLKEIMICRGVYKRNPIKPGFSFTNNIDSLFCYTKISNSGPKQEIKHVWYYQDELITSVVYNIKTSYNYRSWSRKTILPNQIGKWRVDIVDSKNYILGSRDFEISSLNDL